MLNYRLITVRITELPLERGDSSAIGRGLAGYNVQ
jgi:hypothetical protein